MQELVYIRLALGGNPQPYGDLVLASAICEERGINVEKHVYEGLGSGWGSYAALEWDGSTFLGSDGVTPNRIAKAKAVADRNPHPEGRGRRR